MPTLLGEYCIRCGAKCVTTPSEDGKDTVYTCPRGDGVQAIVPTSKTDQTGKDDQKSEHDPKSGSEEAKSGKKPFPTEEGEPSRHKH